MYAGEDFIVTTPNEIRPVAFDFTDAFVTGDNIVGATWTSAVAADSEGSDPSASTRIGGPFSFSGHIAQATLQGCIKGVKYVITCVALSSAGIKAEFESYIYCDEKA